MKEGEMEEGDRREGREEEKGKVLKESRKLEHGCEVAEQNLCLFLYISIHSPYNL